MKKILIIDDDADILELTQKRLERYGYRVLAAKDGAQGLIKVREEKPDLILLDIVMPNQDGFTILRELKKSEATRRIPVIMLTAKSETKSIFEGEEYGAIDYFIKPCDWQELVRYIRKYLDLTSETI